MKDKFVNEVDVQGYVYSIGGNGKIYEGVTKPDSARPNTPFMSGTLNIATDEEGINIVPVRFNFVTEFWKSGSENDTWKVLKEVVDTGNTWANVGKEKAIRVRLQCSVGVNDFLGRDGNMVEAKTVECSFAHFANNGFDESKRNKFKFDMLIAAAEEREVEGGDNYLNLRGYTFNFRNNLIPVNISVTNPGGIKYFESQDISNANPMLTTVWGKIVSTTEKVEKEIESAWGDPQIEYTTRTLRSWDIVGCSPEPMEWDDESTITAAELKELLEAREAEKAAAKARQEENNSKNDAGFPASGSENKPADSGIAGFKF